MHSAPALRPTVLVVEDEANIRELVCLHLGLEEVASEQAANGHAGLDLARSKKFDLVILDLMLPGLDGVTVCKAIRRDSPNADTPILMLTARREESDKVVGLDSGADDYLLKPFAFDELLARVRALLRRPTLSEPIRLSVADLEMDLATRQVSRRGHSIDLTFREFELLNYLMRHEGRVVSRGMLAQRIWRDSARSTTLDNVIDVHMARVRRKIDLAGTTKLIHTVRGVGFTLRVDHS